jgi:seryl-tRNA synthetase
MSSFTGCDKSYICYDENDTHLMNVIDERFRKEALDLGAVEYHIPAMIDQDVLSKCGYFTTFPQHLTIAAHAKREAYLKIAEEKHICNNTATVSHSYFTPAACLHIYPMLENQKLTQKVITTKARVYRYEDEQFNGTTRFWDFTVREIVFIGDSGYVSKCLEHMKSKTLDYTMKIGLPAEICSATDNFYPSKRNSIKQKLQLSNAIKFELSVQVNDNTVAVSSFNYHDTHFSKPFHFDEKGSIVTGCIGYGLERWVAALNYYNTKI